MKNKTIYLSILMLLFFNISMAQNSFSNLGKIAQNEVETFTNYSLLLSEIDELVKIVDVSPELDLEGRKLLFFIHGWSFNGRPAEPGSGYWEHFKNYLLDDPELRANFKPYYVEYWSNSVSINKIAEELRNKVEKEGLHEQKITIIAHSMGGLVARSYMNEHSFTSGIAKNAKCGELVDQLITLGTPHHGSPMANGPARDAEVNSPFASAYMYAIEAFVFKETKYNEVNRSDLRWDNYDEFMNYSTYSNEKNDWLTNLNKNTSFDSKTICYTASVDGQFVLYPKDGNTEEQYKLGAWIQEDLGFKNDGIVPVQSAGFEGHTIKKKRHFDNYNHTDIIRGKENETELFVSLDIDLLDVIPLKLTTFNSSSAMYIKHSQNRLIEWQAPSTAKQLNIYFSADNGNTFDVVATKVDATSGSYQWFVPDINATQCLIKITNAEFENENSISSPFTIFHNKITITSPESTNYIVRSNSNTIKWEQEGLGKKVKIIYSDAQNGIKKDIIAEIKTDAGSNTFLWKADETLPPTDKAEIQIQLLELLEEFGDTEIYTFHSDLFQLFGDPNFTLLSPETNPVDFFGIEGEQLTVGTTSSIKSSAEGEIKFVGFHLCDKDKNILEPITNVSNTPSLYSEKSTRWIVPEYYGDEFYLLAKAGYSLDSILFEVYSDHAFRINKKAEILDPTNNSNDVSFLPCFEIAAFDDAVNYQFFLQDTATNNEPISWQYESPTNALCIPHDIENELLPGTTYNLTATVLIDTIRTFADQITFTAEQSSPWNFNVLSPIPGDSTEANEIVVKWDRAVGASSYSIQLSQMGNLFFNIDNLSASDSTFEADISDVEYYKDIEITVSANNQFGITNASTSTVKRFKTNIDLISKFDEKNLLRNYPNPFTNETTFEFWLPTQSSYAQITLYDLAGNSLGIIASGVFEKGQNQVIWDREIQNGHFIGKGIYLYQLTAGEMVLNKLLMIK